jgi:hypothetical protein
VLVASCFSTPATSLDFRHVLRQVVENTRVRDYSVRLEETTNPSHTVALSARYVPGVCQITALTGSKFVEDVLAELEADDRGAVLEAFLAHEIAHCEDRRRGHSRPRAPDALSTSAPRVLARRDASGALILSPLPYADLWSETLADAYMGAYLHRWHPQRAQRVMTALLARREQFADVDPGHNSARFLKTESFATDADESLIAAAMRIRAQGASRASAR